MTIIRAAKPEDAGCVLELARNLATSFVVEENSFARSFISLLSTPDACLRVAELDGVVVGYVLGFTHETFFANGPVAWVEEIMVREGCRRHGVGRQLMAVFEEWAGCRDAKLIALATRRAAAFYQSLGYAESAAYLQKRL
ncbi:MAG: GCN5-related N-acetyltransferase [Pedosphaera sp.]|nr:GCN5-related N-acetyltransferase [Pedosphaera sp.]